MSASTAPALAIARRISILIPVYNEVRFLRQLLAKVDGVDFCGLEKEVILVDDGSTDGTRDILSALRQERPDYKIIFHEKNQGKGAALRTALQQVSGDIVIIQDADLEYDPIDYPPLVQALLSKEADVVYGSRLSSGESDKGFGTLHYLGNKFLTLVTNLLYQTELSDMETCYKAFRADVIAPVRIRSDRFDFEPEITAKVLKRGYRLKELPIRYQGRAAHEGKKITWRDGVWAVWALVRFRFVD